MNNSEKNKKIIKKVDYDIKHVVGLVIFILITVIIVPYSYFYLVVKGSKTEIPYFLFESWLANIDLIATCLSFHDGPYKSGIFEFLFKRTDTFIGFLSFNIISLITLLAILFIVLLRTDKMNLKDKSGFYTKMVILSQFGIILTITFLFPNRYIEKVMDYTYDKIPNYFTLNYHLKWFITVLIGMIMAILIIGFETIINNKVTNHFIINGLMKTTLIKDIHKHVINH